MAHRKRRRRDLIIIVLGAVAFGVIAAIAAAAGDTERIDGYWVLAEVDNDANANVVEVIDYDFGVERRHGIFRDIPGLDPGAAIVVSSPTAPDQFTVEPYYDETRIRIGDPVSTVHGRHRYTISYPIRALPANVINPGSGPIRFAWNAIGTDWQVAIRNVEVHVVSGNDLTDVQCSLGLAGSWGGCTAREVEPGHVIVSVDKLDPGEGVTVSGLLGAPLSAAPIAPVLPAGDVTDPGTGVVKPAIAAAIAALLGGLVASAVVRRAGREHVWAGGSADAAFGPGDDADYAVRRVDHDELGDMATTEFVPPKELSAWQGGVLLDERAKPDHKVAWLVERAIEGELEFAGEGKNITLSQSAAHPPGVDVLSSMFGGRSTVPLGKYDPVFAKAWTRLDGDLNAWHESSGLWDPVGDQQMRRARVGGVLGLVLGIGALVGSAALANRWGEGWLSGVIVAALIGGVAFSTLLRSWELKIRTPEGSGLWLRVESFRRFIHDSDARHADQAAEMGMLLEYTAWAVAVGEIDRWTKSLERSSVAAEIDTRALYLTHVASDLGRATSSAAQAPSSSGGGGGSVGGGGGGGGGGSW